MQAQPADEQYAQILVLEEYEQDVQPTDYSLETDICTIGRWPTCQIVVNRSAVSRLHAKIERAGPHYVLSDAGSVNGTFVNGQQIHEPHLLKQDDLIGLGSPKPLFRFYDPDPTSRFPQRLHYDERAMTFFLEAKPIPLTPLEFRLLLHLYQHAGEVCTHASCAQAIWGRDYQPGLDAGALEQAMTKLRRKLRQADPSADLIETRRGLGYMLTP